jgi:dipeptidyl aminopeptidase/acylaminoacyl peptidase
VAASAIDRLRPWLDYPQSTLPTVSADGTRLYFISDRGGIPQAWGAPLAGGPATLVTAARERVARVESAPKGTAVLLSTDHGGDEHWQLSLFDGRSEASAEAMTRLTSDPKVIHSAGGWRDEFRVVFTSNRRDIRFFDAYELDIRTPSDARVLHQEDALTEVAAVRAERLVLQRSRSNLDSDLLLATDSGTTLLTPHVGELTIFSADLAAAGVLAGANPEREFAALVRYASPGAAEILKQYSGDVEHLRVDPSGTRVAVSVNRDGWSDLALYDLSTNEERPVPLATPGTVDTFSWTPDGGSLLIDLSSPTTGHEIHRWEVGSTRTTPLTPSPVPLPAVVEPPTLRSFVASDGLRIPYWERVPTDRPVRGTLIVVHGGPEAQERPRFNPTYGFLLGMGWRLILPNVRGSLGYGRTYVHRDDVRLRMDSVRDLRDLAAFLIARGEATSGKLAILGGSYGGFMVLSAISTYPELWGAAVDIVGIANFVTFLERTGAWRRRVREAEYGSLEHDREFLEAISPIHHTDRIRSPLLVIHGANDPRVPVSEAEQIVRALQDRRVPVEFLRYENEGHGIIRRENRLEAYARAAEFLAEHLDGVGPSPAGGTASPLPSPGRAAAVQGRARPDT